MHVLSLGIIIPLTILAASCDVERQQGYSSATATYVSVSDQEGVCLATVNESTYVIPSDEHKFKEELRLSAIQAPIVGVVTLGSLTSNCWMRVLHSVDAAGFKFVSAMGRAPSKT